MEHDPDRLPYIDANALKMTASNVERFSPNSLSIMEFVNQNEIDIAEKLYGQHPFLGKYLKDNWDTGFQREFHITDNSDLFLTSDEAITKDTVPLWEGKQIWILSDSFSEPNRWLSRIDGKIKPTSQKTRLAYRDITAKTNERTLIPTVVPSPFPTGNTLSICPLPERVAVMIASIAGSFTMDWILRGKVTSHASIFIVNQLPIVDIDNHNPKIQSITCAILCRGCRLLCTSKPFAKIWEDCFVDEWTSSEYWYPGNGIYDYGPVHEKNVRKRIIDSIPQLKPKWTDNCGLYDSTPNKEDIGDRAQFRAEIDAYVAHLYGLSRDEFAYILDTFPVLKRKEEKAFGEFMSKRKCLEEYERIGKLGITN